MKANVEALLSPHGHSLLQSFLGLYRKATTSDFVQKVAATFVTRILLIGIGLVTSVIVARALGPEGRGLYAVAATIGAIGVQFGNLGLHASNTYYAARDRRLLPALVGNTIVVSFAFGSLGIVLTWITFFFWPNLAPVHGLLLILSLIWIPFGLAYLLLQNLLLGIQDVRAYNKIELGTKLFGLSLMGSIIIIKIVSVQTVFSVGLVALVFAFVWGLRLLLRHFTSLPIASFSVFKNNILYGFKVYLAGCFAFLVLKVDLLMVKYILGSEQAGYYSIAVNMADLVYVLPLVVGSILFPKLSAMSIKEEKWRFTKQVAMTVGLGTLILAVFAALLSEQIVRLLFGKAFVPSVPAFIWLMPGIVMLSLASIFSSYIASEYIPVILILLYFLMALLNITMNWYLLPVFGIIGAAVSSTISYLFILIGLVLIGINLKRVEK